MAVSINANTLANQNTVFTAKTKLATNYVANHTEKKQSVSLSSGGKSVAQIMQESEQDKLEDDRLLRKMQLSKTRLDAMGEYFGAMQTAEKASGRNGFFMFQRVTNLAGTQRDFEESETYKNMKVTDTFISDQVDALRELQKEFLEEQQARETEQKRQEANQDEGAQNADSYGSIESVTAKDKDSSAALAAQAEKQQAGVKVYQNSFANQKKGQTSVNLNSMI